MAAKARPIPEGFHSVTPHLTVRDAVKMIEFYKKAFGAKEIEVKKMPDGKVMHAKIKIGDTFVMLNAAAALAFCNFVAGRNKVWV